MKVAKLYTMCVWEFTRWKGKIIRHKSKRTDVKEWCRISEWRREIEKRESVSPTHTEKRVCLKSDKTSKKNTMFFARQKIRGRDGGNEGKSKNVFSRNYTNMRGIIDQPKSGVLKTDKTVLEKHLKDTDSDPNESNALDHNNNLVWPAAPKVGFDMKPSTRKRNKAYS